MDDLFLMFGGLVSSSLGCYVWWDVMFGGMLCLEGCCVWRDVVFGRLSDSGIDKIFVLL